MDGNTTHWTETITHEKLATPEAKQALAKYSTLEDALVGGLDAQKLVGKKKEELLSNAILKPGKDAKPEEIAAYHASLAAELGAVDSEEALNDLNFSEGLPEGSKTDETTIKEFKKFIIDNKMPKGLAQKATALFNKITTGATQQIEQQFKVNAEKTNTELEQYFGGKEKLAEKSELIRRMFQNNAGLTAEEYEAVSGYLVDTRFVHSTAGIKALAAIADKISAEGSTHNGEGGNKTDKGPAPLNEQLPKTAKALGW